MLCPETWAFDAPKVSVKFDKNFSLTKNKNIFNTNFMYHSVTIALPDSIAIPENITDVLKKDLEYFKITDCNLSELIDSSFITDHLLQGTTHSVSINRRSEVDLVFAIYDKTKLFLHIDKQTFHTLGLDGKRELRGLFYEMTIDLAKEELLKSSKNLTRLKNALAKLGPFDFIMKYQPDHTKNGKIEDFFIAKDLQIEKKHNKTAKSLNYVDCIPIVNDENIPDITEWLAMLSLGCNIRPEVDYVSNYETNWDSSLEAGQVAMYSAEGCFTSSNIAKLYQELSTYIKTRESDHWVWFSAQSFKDAPARCDISAPYIASPTDYNMSFFITPNRSVLYAVGNKVKL